MDRDNRGPGSPSARRRSAFRPASESLEGRQLLTTLNLAGIQTAAQTTPAATQRIGVQLVGNTTNQFAGATVTDVGDVNGSGFDSFVVAATGTTNNAVYLVFGAPGINARTALGSIGDLGTLNQPTQVDPAVVPTVPPTTITPFNGLKFVTGLNPATGVGTPSGLGFSVAAVGDLNGDGFDDFLIGAPTDAGRGRAFLVYGGSQLSSQSAAASTIDLEPISGAVVAPTKVVRFVSSAASPSDAIGTSVAGIGNFFNTTTGARDIAIGDPGFAPAGTTTASTGAVFAISGAFLNGVATGSSVDLATIGTTGTAGITYVGISPGDQTGFSVSSAGNFDGSGVDSLLIGAPGAAATAGRAYLVYGTQNTAANAQRGTTQLLAGVLTPPGTNPVTTPLQGVAFTGLTAGSRLGVSVSSTGDFNGFGKDDIIIGAPGLGTGTGVVGTGFASLISLISGATTATRPTNVAISADPSVAVTNVSRTDFLGAATGDLTGVSVSSVGNFQGTTASATNGGVLIGASGANGFSGAAYLVNDQPALGGTNVNLSSLAASANGTVITTTSSAPGFAAAVGISVSGLPAFVRPSTNTLGDNAPAVIVGAAGFTLVDPVTQLPSTNRLGAGAGFALLGSALGLVTNVTPPPPPPPPGGGGGPTGQFTFTALSLPTPPIFTGDNAGLPYPTASSLSHLTSYRPLPVQLAYDQFLPTPGFRAREEAYHHPGRGQSHQAPRGSILNVAAIGKSENKYAGKQTYPGHVFRTGRLHHGETITFTHPQKVIPRNEQTQTFRG